jgi:DNA-binding CsgD family transcriptional regulator
VTAVAGELLLERDAELAQIDASLAAVKRGGGFVLLLEAGAGLGKTQLLNAAALRARGQGMTVLSARATELEHESPFGIVRQLFGPVIAAAEPQELTTLLRGPAGLAASILLGSEPDEAPAPGITDRAPALTHGLYWLLANLAEQRPTLLILDDAHWSDRQSLRFVLFLVARLGELPVGIFVARRPSGGDAAEATEELITTIAAEPSAEVLALRALSVRAVGELVMRELGNEVAAEFTSAVHEATAGNPFFVRELLRETARERIAPDEEGARQVRDLVPSKVARAVVVHLARLTPQTPQVAKAAAILGDGAEPRHVWALSETPAEQGRAAADAMIRAGLLVDDGRLSFSHPIVRSAVYADMGVHERSEAHRRAAQLLAADRAEAIAIAQHLLEAAPAGDETVVATLRSAAAIAIERGAPESAVSYLRRAMDEPPVHDRAATALELGTAEALAAEPTAAQTLAEALELAEDPTLRGQAALTLGRGALLAGQTEQVAELLQRAIRELEPVDPQLALITRAELNNARLFSASTAPLAHSEAGALLEEAQRLGPPASWHVLASLASLRAIEGADAAEVSRLAMAAVADGALLASVGPESPVAHLPAWALIFVDRFAQARAVVDGALAESRRRGSPAGFANASCFSSHLHYRVGELREAEADARAAANISSQLPLMVLVTRAFLADALLERGETEEAYAAVAGFELPIGAGGVQNHLLHTRGRVLTALGRPADALKDLLACGAGNDGIGAVNPGTIPWRAAAAEALIALGQDAEAKRLAYEELVLSRRYGARRALGISLLASARTQRGERRLAMLRESVEVLSGSGARLEHARALVELGASLRRANSRQAAREPLIAGLELAHACGASALERLARDELKATGARPRRLVYSGVDSLTASELRVARLAAAGQTNQEIAQALFVTRKTVESHLSGAYSKLGIGSRRELANVLRASG